MKQATTLNPTFQVSETVLERNYGHATKIRVIGLPTDVDRWSAAYRARYAPNAYDTVITTVSETADMKTVLATRSHSCD